MTEQRKRNRKIAIPNFYGKGNHIYEDELGWTAEDRREARTNVSKEIFEFQVLNVRWNLTFYYIDNDTFYEVFGELTHVEFAKPPRDRSQEFLCDQCPASHWPDECELIKAFDRDEDVWPGIVIDGHPLDEVLERSYIVELS